MLSLTGPRRNDSFHGMPLIPDETIEAVKAATDIVEIVSEHVQLRKTGRNWVGLCPFHNEKSPSFNVNPDLQSYHCFGCDVGGTAIKFVQEIDKVSFPEAVRYLAERAGIPMPRQGGSPADDERNDRLFRANELAAKYFEYMLRQPAGADALRYLHRRGLSDETITAFRLGYAPAGWTNLLDMATAPKRGFRVDELERAGLIKPSRNGPGHYDSFRERVIFPITNLSGRPIAFGARALRDDDQPKYLNSPETPIYHKSGVLYGMSRARDTIRREGTAIVVEGYMDVISLAQAGVDNVIASSGTALTPQHARLLTRYAERVVLLFDGDAAGGNAAQRGLEVLLGTELDTRIATLPDGQDPDTFVGRDRGPEELRQLLEKAPPALDVYLDRLARGVDMASVAGRSRVMERLLPLIAQCKTEVSRSLMIRRAAQRLDVDEQALRTDLSSAQKRPAPRRDPDDDPRAEQRPAAPRRQVAVNRLEREFAALLLQYPRLLPQTASRIEWEMFTDDDVHRLLQFLVERHAGGGSLDLTSLLDEVEADLAPLVTSCTMETFVPDSVDEIWEDHVHRMEFASLTRQIEEAKREIRRAVEGAGNVEELLRRQNELIVRRVELEARRTAPSS
jgi:DNA primase